MKDLKLLSPAAAAASAYTSPIRHSKLGQLPGVGRSLFKGYLEKILMLRITN